MNKKMINIILGVIFLTAAVTAADFKSFKRDLKRSGAVTEQAAGTLTQKLEKKLGGAAWSSPIVYKGMVFLGDLAGKIWAFDASGENSTPIWQYATAGKVVASLVADNGVIYAISQDGNLYAFNYLSGAVIFTYNIGSMDSSSPAIYGGCLYGGTGHPNKIVYCFNLNTRTMAWTKDVGQYVQSSPAFGEGIVYIGASNGRIYAFDALTGEEKWYFQTKGGVYLSSPCVSADGKLVYFLPGNDDRKVYAFDAKTGELKSGWGVLDFGTTPTVVSSITEEEGVIYFVSGGVPSTLYAVDAVNGTQKWSKALDNASATDIVSSPVLVNGVLYVGSAAKKIYAINAADGTIINTYPTAVPVLSSPAVANGKIYVGAGEMGDGYLYIYQAAKVSALTYPEDGSAVAGEIAVKGVLVNSALTSYKLEYSSATSVSWIKINEATTIPADGVVGTFSTSGLKAGSYSIRLTAIDGSTLNGQGIIGFSISYALANGSIGIGGGTISNADGTSVVFDPGALTGTNNVTIDIPGAYANSGYPLNFTASTIVRSFSLSNAADIYPNNFPKTVTVSIPYGGGSGVGGINENNFRVAVWDPIKTKWLIVNTSKVIKAGVGAGKITATVSHFFSPSTIYRVFEFTGAADLINKDTVYAYPNPALGNDAVFKCYLGSDASIKVSVYNIAGELVKELTASGLGGNGVEIPWNIKDYASGVYVFKLEAVATATGERKYVTKKLAIIH